MSLEMWEGLGHALVELRDNPDVRVVILVGAGDKAFVSGADISQFEKTRHNAAASEEYSKRSEAQRALLASYPKPTIACIRGFCLGGGMQVAMLTDIRIASDNSQFGIPAAKLGIAYGYDGLKHLVSLVGPSWARLIMYTGMRIEAAEALRIGLVDRVLPDAELWDATMEIARTISGNAPLAIKAAKITICRSAEGRKQARHGRDQEDRHGLHGLAKISAKAERLSWKSASRSSRGSNPTAPLTLRGHHPRRRMIQYSRDASDEPRRRGVLDTRLRGYDGRWSWLVYSAAITAFVISAVPLLPPNSIGLIAPA